MGPRTRAQDLAAQSRSRFLEGSMNDRASAAPPVAFLGLGPTELAALERPACAEDMRRPSDDKHHGRRPARMRLGLVWEGMRGKLRLRREQHDEPANAMEGRKRPDDQASPGEVRPRGADDRPSREDVLASYHQLMAAGFFANHAVQSTRQPPPGTRPVTSHDPNHRQPPRPSYDPDARDVPSSPQWPLTPRASGGCSPLHAQQPFCSPVSIVSSRGTKRAAPDASDEGDTAPRSPLAGDEDLSTLAHRFLPKRLRRTASRDISLPRMRSTIRSVSAMSSTTVAVPGCAPATTSSPSNASSEAPSRDEPADGGLRFGSVPRHMASLRNLRPRLVGGPLSVVPDANRGIPRVPTIPTKFTVTGGRDND
ncbi:hypothetical protein HIM_05068 [Hirsutella minnesotensis 3608]|uniref:Uncharacterized protein n=1 Tax=Hirsutella minnesotensis 3608 TaxID=1043627 RepID=A0A0F7ZPJ4_9HYPO|nr:hypothetical protein HIM_05068 [Hirsutella minnesotensis 3608]